MWRVRTCSAPAAGMYGNSLKLAGAQGGAEGGARFWMYLLTWETPVDEGRLRRPTPSRSRPFFDNVERPAISVGRGDELDGIADQMSTSSLARLRPVRRSSLASLMTPRRRATMQCDLESRVVNDPLPGVRAVLQT